MPPQTPPLRQNTKAHHLELYRTMQRIRVFEEIAVEVHRAGEFNGYLHPSTGQEAVPAGVCANLRPDDRLTSTHRGHGHGLAKGADATRMMAELYGRATGACGGKGGSMHIADFSVGMLGANGIVAGGLPIAVGAAQGLKLLGSDAVVACFFGDGSTNRGPFLEALNWASLYKLRVVFVCEDNGFSAFTYSDQTTAGNGPPERARSLGVEAVSVDGNDVVAVDEAARDVIAAVRAECRPMMLHARTYRWYGHTSMDPVAYRRAGEMEREKLRDPLLLLRRRLIEAGVSEGDIGAIDREVANEMAAARDAARSAPLPKARDAYSDVQDLGAVQWQS
ncbi:MAG TPA: thiamine pyrophosphate-dependent dehydrogenase E1 component subunit alpha [Hyphomicrobiaceae bacterium]|nr:thiamine pyrophosphate-dependent dehydrogenase E1 component subunit alpha [Hyphomicrobiaceae bacterium]